MSDDALHWVARREPSAPTALAAHVAASLGATLPNDGAAAPTTLAAACLDAAEVTLARVLADGGNARAAALDLLTADALVTYAFEAASEQPDALPAAARDAMVRLSRAGSAAAAS